MSNKHIVVDEETARCLCGVYDMSNGTRRPVFCSDLLAILDRAEHWARAELNPSMLVAKGGKAPSLMPEDIVLLVDVIRSSEMERP